MSDVVIMVTALVVALALMFGQPLIALFAILLGLLGYVVAEVEKT